MPDPIESEAAEFQRLALVHLRAIYRVAYGFARNVAAAEDLTQETYLQAWKSFQRYDRALSCRAWLCGILHHVWSHERRRRERDPLVARDSTGALAERLLYDPPTPEALTEEEVLAAFDALPETVRDTVLLADVEELSYREIAAILAVPVGTVMSRLNRGRKLLRQALASYARARGIGRSDEDAQRRKANE